MSLPGAATRAEFGASGRYMAPDATIRIGALRDFRIAAPPMLSPENCASPERSAATSCAGSADHEDLHVDSRLCEEALVLGVERERGGLERQGRDRHRRRALAARTGGDRPPGRSRNEQQTKNRHHDERAPQPDPPRIKPGGHCAADPSILLPSPSRIKPWSWLRASRNRGALRVSVCERGRGRPTAIEPVNRPGAGLRTRTRSAR